MIYAMSDIHGCYDKYLAMLKKIAFRDSDNLFVLGDVVDRGEQPIQVLQDMCSRANVFPILGNHDYLALVLLQNLSAEITDEACDTLINSNLMEGLSLWISDGGQTTLDGFRKLPKEEREYLLEYLLEFSLYETITVNNKKFILTHSGLPGNRDLNSYDILDFITAKTDYSRQFFSSAFLVTGHTPTFLIDEKYRGRIYREHNHIAIDTGAVFGETLGCICLDTGAEFYV